MFNGIKMINSAIKMFTAIVEKLAQGIIRCQQQLGKNEADIDIINDKNKELKEGIEKATKLKKNIESLLQ